jgi:molybdate transport system substrate-binding protein
MTSPFPPRRPFPLRSPLPVSRERDHPKPADLLGGPGVRERAVTRAAMIVLAALAASISPAIPPASASAAPPSQDQLLVFAAASLKDIFAGLARDFAAANPGVKVVFNFAGSQELRAQIEQAAPADLFASADRQHMDALHRAALVQSPAVFARNQLAVAAPRDNPARLRVFADLPRATRLIVGAPQVPVGRYTELLLAAAGQRLGAAFKRSVEANIVSRELNVRQVLAKVTLGEVDAGIVYQTDVRAAGDQVVTVPIPPAVNVSAEYPIAVVRASPRARLAAAWVALVMSPAGQQRLRQAGFLPPLAVTSARSSPPASSPAP